MVKEERDEHISFSLFYPLWNGTLYFMYFYISFQSVLFKNNKKEEKILFIVLCGQNAKSNMALREDPLLTLGTSGIANFRPIKNFIFSIFNKIFYKKKENSKSN